LVGSALAGRSIGGPTAAAGIEVSRGQHVQQGRPTARTTGPRSPTNPGNRPRVHKPFMHRCILLRFRIVHRLKPPQGETRPKEQVNAPPFPWTQRNPNSPGHRRPGIGQRMIRRTRQINSRRSWRSCHTRREGSNSLAIRQIARSRPELAKPSHTFIGLLAIPASLATFFGDQVLRCLAIAGHHTIIDRIDPKNCWHDTTRSVTVRNPFV
jgi:hypothetical protein